MMPGFSNFGLSRSSSVRSSAPQSTVSPSQPVNIKIPYWAGTEEEVQAAQAVPSRSSSRRIGRKPVAASKATTPTITAPSLMSAAPAQPYSYEPLTRSPYVNSSILYWQDQVAAAAKAQGAPPRPLSPPYVPREEVQHQPGVAKPSDRQSQIRPLSPGSIFANGGTPPAPPATRKASLAAISRGIGSLRKAATTAKQALTPQHEPKISSPVAGSFHSRIPAGHVLEPQEDVAPLNLVGLEVAQADVPRFGQPDFKIAAAQEAAAHAKTASARAEAYEMLIGEPTPDVAAPSTHPAANSASPKKTVLRKVVDSTMDNFFDAGMDDSWVPALEGKVSTPGAPTAISLQTNNVTVPKKPFAALVPAAMKIRTLRNANQPLPSTSVTQTPAPSAMPEFNLAIPSLLQRTPAPTQAPLQVPRSATPAGKTGLAASLGTRGASYLPGVTCTQCGKVVDAVAVRDHRCGKKSASDRDPQPSDWSREQLYRSNFEEAGAEYTRSEVFIDTHIRAAYSSWRAGRRQ